MADAAQARGFEALLFDFISDVDRDGIIFFHLSRHPAVRAQHKRMMAHFASRTDLLLIPDYRSTVLFDDLAEQLRQLKKYTLKTKIFSSPKLAIEFLQTGDADLPFVSKTSVGSGIRTINTLDEARKEVRSAFGDVGLKDNFGAVHHGMLYWQEMLDAPKVYRVIIVGSQAIATIRKEGDSQPLDFLDSEATNAIHFARAIAEAEGFKFVGLDVVKTNDGWRLVKLMQEWKLKRILRSRFFPCGKMGDQFWEVAAKELEKGTLTK